MLFFKIIFNFIKDPNYRELIFISTAVVAFGTVTFKYLEGWSWVDALYFSVVTLTTVGYGDFSPQTDAGKLFAILYILIGVGIILNFIQVAYEHFKSERFDKKKQS